MIRIGIGNDTHRLVEGRSLVLGGVQIASDRGAEGHSDADALSHAIAERKVIQMLTHFRTQSRMRFSVHSVRVIWEFTSRIAIHSGVARTAWNYCLAWCG